MTAHTPNNLVQPTNEVSKAESREGAGVDAPALKRPIAGTEGEYTLRTWRDASGKSRQFPCKVLKLSAEFIKLAGPVTGTVGEWVSAYFDKFGQFEGPITDISDRHFVMWIVATAEHRRKIASKIAWANDRKSQNRRRHERFVPRESDSFVRLADGRSAPCQIIDYSVSGVAVSAEIIPRVGAVIKVGNILGQVVRQFAEGFTVKFLIIQDLRTIENLFTKP